MSHKATHHYLTHKVSDYIYIYIYREREREREISLFKGPEKKL